MGNSVNAYTTTESTSRKRQRVLWDKTSLKSKRLKKSHRPRRTIASAAAATSSTGPNGANILSLPLELQQEILSYTSARDAARLRGVCKGLDAVIMNSSEHLVKLYTGQELSRLRKAVNEFEGLKIPTDVDSLLKAVHVWTKRRGFFSYDRASQASMFKLMAHFYVNMHRDHDNRQGALDRDADDKWGSLDIVRWSALATDAAHMISSPLKDSEIDYQFERLNRTGKLDYNGLDKLLGYSAEPQSQAENHRLVSTLR